MSDIIETAKRVLALSATAAIGPYVVHKYDEDAGSIHWQIQQERGEGEVIGSVDEEDCASARATAHFIAATRTDAPALAAYVAAVAPLIERLRQIRDSANGPPDGRFTSIRDLRSQHWDATDALLDADAAARGGK